MKQSCTCAATTRTNGPAGTSMSTVSPLTSIDSLTAAEPVLICSANSDTIATVAPDVCAAASVPSTPRVTVHDVVPSPPVTSMISSSTWILNGPVAGKPSADVTARVVAESSRSAVVVVDAGSPPMWMPGSANVGNVSVAKLAATPCGPTMITPSRWRTSTSGVPPTVRRKLRSVTAMVTTPAALRWIRKLPPICCPAMTSVAAPRIRRPDGMSSGVLHDRRRVDLDLKASVEGDARDVDRDVRPERAVDPAAAEHEGAGAVGRAHEVGRAVAEPELDVRERDRDDRLARDLHRRAGRVGGRGRSVDPARDRPGQRALSAGHEHQLAVDLDLVAAGRREVRERRHRERRRRCGHIGGRRRRDAALEHRALEGEVAGQRRARDAERHARAGDAEEAAGGQVELIGNAPPANVCETGDGGRVHLQLERAGERHARHVLQLDVRAQLARRRRSAG